MPTRVTTGRLLGILLTLALVSCNNVYDKRRIEILDESIDQYNSALRWAFYNEVENYHMRKDGTRLHIDRDALKDIRITGYSVREKTLNEDLTEATVTGEFEYYNVGQARLKKVKFTHNWWYEPQLKRWFIDSDFPGFE